MAKWVPFFLDNFHLSIFKLIESCLFLRIFLRLKTGFWKDISAILKADMQFKS